MHNSAQDALAAIKEKCEYAISLAQTDYDESRLMWDKLCSEYFYSSFVHVTHAEHCITQVTKSGSNLSVSQKQNLLRDAHTSAQCALALEPNSASCSFLVAKTVFEKANDDAETYGEVMEQCTHALKIQKDMPKEMKKDIKKLKDDAEFLNKTINCWCNLSYEGRCKILNVSSNDLEQFSGTVKLRDTRASCVLHNAVKQYNEKGHWFTWSCCFCPPEKSEITHQDWSSIITHVISDLGISGLTTEYLFKCINLDKYDSLHLDGNGCFILDKKQLIGEVPNIPGENAKFLKTWLRKDSDAEAEFGLWQEGTLIQGKLGQKILEYLMNQKTEFLKIQQKIQGNDQTEEYISASHRACDIKAAIIDQIKNAVCLSTYDYRKILIPFIKSFIQARLVAEAYLQKLTQEDVENKNTPKKSKKSRKRKGKKVLEQNSRADEEKAEESQVLPPNVQDSEVDEEERTMLTESIPEEIQRSNQEEMHAVDVHPQDVMSVNEEDKKYPPKEDDLLNKIKVHWRDLSFEEKYKHLKVNVNDLETHLLIGNDKNPCACEILTEAVDWFEDNAHWLFWSCCLCDDNKEGREDWSSIEKHIQSKHFGKICPEGDGNSMAKFTGSYDNLVLDFCGNIIVDKEEDFRTSGDDQDFLTKWFKSNPDITSALESWNNRSEVKKLEGWTILENIGLLKREIELKRRRKLSDKNTMIHPKVIALKEDAIRHSTYDFREILMPILISFIKDRLLNKEDKTVPDDINVKRPDMQIQTSQLPKKDCKTEELNKQIKPMQKKRRSKA